MNPAVTDLKPIHRRTFEVPKQRGGPSKTDQITDYYLPLPHHDHPTGVMFPSGKYEYQPEPGAKYQEAVQ